MASAVSMAPDCYAGVIADSPFVDPLTTLLDPSSPLTVSEWEEWGNPLENQKVFEYIRSYSPCENLPSQGKQEGKGGGEAVQEWRFPSVLAIVAKQDARVSYRESLKWVSLLQEIGADAVVNIIENGSHGGGSGKYRRWEKFAMQTAWCLDIIGCSN